MCRLIMSPRGPKEVPKEPTLAPNAAMMGPKRPVEGPKGSMKSQQVSVAKLDELASDEMI